MADPVATNLLGRNVNWDSDWGTVVAVTYQQATGFFVLLVSTPRGLVHKHATADVKLEPLAGPDGAYLPKKP